MGSILQKKYDLSARKIQRSFKVYFSRVSFNRLILKKYEIREACLKIKNKFFYSRQKVLFEDKSDACALIIQKYLRGYLVNQIYMKQKMQIIQKRNNDYFTSVKINMHKESFLKISHVFKKFVRVRREKIRLEKIRLDKIKFEIKDLKKKGEV